MSDINVEEARINFEGKWLSANDLTKMIQKKMGSGNLKFAAMAAALEELNQAMENAHTLEETVVIEKQDYEKLMALGGVDEKESVRKAIMSYIGEDEKIEPPQVQSKDGKSVKCTNCNTLISMHSEERPIVLDCPRCGTSCHLTV